MFARCSVPIRWPGAFLALAVCVSCTGRGQGSQVAAKNDLIIDGSSTIYPIVSGMADDFAKGQPDLNIIVNSSGTGSGMQKFLRHEIDIAAASRPVEKREGEELQGERIDFLEIPFAIDGVCVIVNKSNSWASHLSMPQLQKAWERQSGIRLWSDLDPAWPHQKISFYGPTDNHGTYDYFTEAVAPNSSLRNDVQTNQEYNAIVQAVAEDPYGIGYVGMAYFYDNGDKLKACAIDFGHGPIAPSQETISSGAYAPLSRPLLLYVDKAGYDRKPSVKAFVQFALSDKGEKDVAEAHYVKLSDAAMDLVRKRVAAERTGTAFADRRSFSPDRLIEAESK